MSGRKTSDFGYIDSTRLQGLVQAMNWRPCRTQVIYRMSLCPAADSSGSDCIEWADDQHKSGETHASARARPPCSLTPTISRPCVMTCLVGGSDKYNILGKAMNSFIPQLWVKHQNCCSSIRIAWALNNPWSLICH